MRKDLRLNPGCIPGQVTKVQVARRQGPVKFVRGRRETGQGTVGCFPAERVAFDFRLLGYNRLRRRPFALRQDKGRGDTQDQDQQHAQHDGLRGGDAPALYADT